ncbi:thioredoxin-like protein [Chitinophaga sp. S165]|nr:thioredoxin-like protein [Chitinophaga sp. S165]
MNIIFRTMNANTYQQLFISILADPAPLSPYNNPTYMNYVKLNQRRIERWHKHGILNPELIAAVQRIDKPQTWTIITEAWCGDAAHTQPFIQMVAEKNPLITLDYQLRDSPPFLIESHLTNGKKAIPKLVITDGMGNELASWGSRPAQCQALFYELVAAHVSHDDKEIAIQKWYNEDKGVSVQLELLTILERLEAF